MGYKNRCHPKLFMQFFCQNLQLFSRNSIQGRKGFIHEENLGLTNHSSDNTDPLLFSTR
ncbi:Uncharacterised protein [Mycobacterium tuberculosis]|nr:Uncharacterised protein [Mycobacterium tuberculosis]